MPGGNPQLLRRDKLLYKLSEKWARNRTSIARSGKAWIFVFTAD